MDISDYCRQIETYLCRKNDGHLIRVVGPSFDLVSTWAAEGVPLKVAFRGIDRCFERYYRQGARRRPVRIDFCEADVLDVFDEWRRAVGITASAAQQSSESTEGEGVQPEKRGRSLPAHLERVLIQLTNARASGALGPEADQAIDRVVVELDRARSSPSGLRGLSRHALKSRLVELDADLLRVARATFSPEERHRLEQDAETDLASFRDTMTRDAYAHARELAIDGLVRERLRLPVLIFH